MLRFRYNIKKALISATYILIISSFILPVINVKSNQLQFNENDIFNTTFDEEQVLYLLKGKTYFTLYAIEDVNSFNVIFSIPPNYQSQAPIFLKILDNTTANIIDYRIENDTNPPNKILNFTIGNINKKERTYLNFEYWTLSTNRDYKELSDHIDFPDESEFPEEIKLWFYPTESVQSDRFIFKIKVNQLIDRSNNNLLTFAENVGYLTKTKRGDYDPNTRKPKQRYYLINAAIPNILYRLFPEKFNYFHRQFFIYKGHNLIIATPMFEDAFSVYFNKGTCVGQANLAAALFRAAGVPAKILICEPIPFPNVYHCIVQYYIPDYGWIWMDQSNAWHPFPPKLRIVLRVCYPEDENNAGHGLKKYGGVLQDRWIKNDKVFGSVTRGKPLRDENNMTVDFEFGNVVFNLTQDVWELFTKFAGRDLGFENNQHILNSTIAQQSAVECFYKSNIDGYLFNMTYAYNEYLKIESS
jgi:hypothetical protein